MNCAMIAQKTQFLTLQVAMCLAVYVPRDTREIVHVLLVWLAHINPSMEQQHALPVILALFPRRQANGRRTAELKLRTLCTVACGVLLKR